MELVKHTGILKPILAIYLQYIAFLLHVILNIEIWTKIILWKKYLNPSNTITCNPYTDKILKYAMFPHLNLWHSEPCWLATRTFYSKNDIFLLLPQSHLFQWLHLTHVCEAIQFVKLNRWPSCKWFFHCKPNLMETAFCFHPWYSNMTDAKFDTCKCKKLKQYDNLEWYYSKTNYVSELNYDGNFFISIMGTWFDN